MYIENTTEVIKIPSKIGQLIKIAGLKVNI